jgi:hypothetical protein
MTESTARQDFCATDELVRQPQQPSAGISVVTARVQTAHTDASGDAAASVLPPGRFERELEDAESLIRYAADVGIDVGDDLRKHVVAARIAASGGWSEEHTVNLQCALTKLSARLKPVSGESLRACVSSTRASRTMRNYRWVAIVLGLGFITPFSLAAFIATVTCEAIRKDIDVANALAVTLAHELRPASANQRSSNATGMADAPGQQHGEKEIKDLQQFAATIRAIDARAAQLNFFAVYYRVPDPYADIRGNRGEMKAKFELPAAVRDLSDAASRKIELYQDVRHFAQSVQEAVSTTFGAMASCILPMLYALLGACAYLLRLFEDQIKTRSFTGADKPTARFLIAGIGGLVVGLFGNFGTGHGATLPPLAIAFLVGYAVDVFFSFLEGLLQTFSRSRGDMTQESRTAAQTAGSR